MKNIIRKMITFDLIECAINNLVITECIDELLIIGAY